MGIEEGVEEGIEEGIEKGIEKILDGQKKNEEEAAEAMLLRLLRLIGEVNASACEWRVKGSGSGSANVLRASVVPAFAVVSLRRAAADACCAQRAIDRRPRYMDKASEAEGTASRAASQASEGGRGGGQRLPRSIVR